MPGKQSAPELYAQPSRALFKVFGLCFFLLGVGWCLFLSSISCIGLSLSVKLYITVKCPGGRNTTEQKPGCSPETPSSVPEL